MAFILEHSEPAMLAENHLFMVPASYTDRWKTEEERIQPTAAVTEDTLCGDFSFYLPSSTVGLLSLCDMSLEFEVCLKKKKPTDAFWQTILPADKMAPVNNFAHSLFQSVQVELANRLISDCATHYPYRAYLETVLGASRGAMLSHLSTAAFYLDEAGKMEDPTNKGEVSRKDLMTGPPYWVQMSGRLFSDITLQDKPLLPGVSMKVKYILGKPEFYLRTWPAPVDDIYEFRAFIRKPVLYVKRYIPTPDYLTAVTQQLQTKTAKYHIERTIMRVYDITRSTQSTVVANLHIGQIPKVMFLGFVSSASFHGDKKSNPFNFQHFNINALSVEIDGQSYPAKPYQPNFSTGASLECYNGLLDTLGKKNSAFGEMPFDRIGYNHGYTLFGFDLTPGHTGRGAMTLIRQGNLSVRVAFADPLTETVMMVCMLVMDNLLEINHHRNLIADFTA